MLRKLALWIADHPKTSVCLVLIGTGLLLLNIRELKIDSSTQAFMGEHDPLRGPYEAFKERFGSDVLTLVVVSAPGEGDVFEVTTLNLIQRMTDQVYDMEGVVRVQSLTTVNQILGEDDYINTEPLFDEIPSDPEILAAKRRSALGNPLLRGNVVSEDGRHAAINIFTDAKTQPPGFEATFVDSLNQIIQAESQADGVYQVGAPRFNVFFNESIEADQRTLVPVAVVVILIILFLVFRKGLALVIPMVTAGISIAAAMGFMAWMGYTVTAVSVMVPSIIIVVGCTEDVHLISDFFKFFQQLGSVKKAIIKMVDHSFLPISLTTLTTMLGFGALALNDIPVLREFGIVTFAGLAFNYITTLVFVPALLHLMKESGQHQPSRLRGIMDRMTEAIIQVNLKRSRTVSLVTVLIVVLAVVGCLRLDVNNDPISFFDASRPIIQDFQRVHRDLCGGHGFSIEFEAEQMGDLYEPDVMRLVARVQDFVGGLPQIDKVISPVDFLKTMNREMKNDPNAFEIPKLRETIAEYLLLLDSEDLQRHLEPENQFANMVVRHNLSGSKAVKAVLNEIETFMTTLDWHYAIDGQVRSLKWAFTGESILLHNATDAMILGQVKSLSLALLAILMIISLLFMSFKAGLVAMFSNVIPIVINFGLMGWLDIPFNTGTCLVATIALGIAVDDTIHFMVRYQAESRRTSVQHNALIQSVRAESHPILTTSFALFFGFGVMVLSNFVPSVHFGFLSALIILYALLTDLLVNPVILAHVQLITIWDYIGLKVNREVIFNSSIFKGFNASEIKKMALLASLKKAPAFERIVEEGTRGEALFILLSGEAVVFVESSKSKILRTLKPGDLFGEMALLGAGERTASVRTVQPSQFMEIDQAALGRVARRNPKIALKFFRNISAILSSRVKSQTDLIVGPDQLDQVDRTIRTQLPNWDDKPPQA